ncbi:MAG: stage IV sporulation protein A, partial [Pseudobutyrivibrio sp.]|nr:stage IV sporulation protein A [Pseudobutyrivibrio sp.]
YIEKTTLSQVDLATGQVKISMTLEKSYYYENISQLAGVPITGEYQLLSYIGNLSNLRKSYEKVADAMQSVEQKGYGVVSPELSDITMEEPVLIRHGNKFGVKMKALSPSIHMIRANIETEIAPIVGSEEQAQDLIAYIKEGQKTKEGVFETNIFGKSIGELMEDGMRSKIAAMDDECQLKLQDTMQKIVNDNNGGLICIII